MTWRDGAVLLHDGVHGHHGHDPDGGDGRALGVEELLSSMACGSRCLTASMRTGYGAAAGWRKVASTGASGMGQSTLPAPASSTRWAALSPWRGHRDRPAHRQVRLDRQTAGACLATTCRWSSLGTFILAFGWFGFNPGSTLAGTDLRISFVVVNTMLASITGAIGAHVALSFKGLKPDPTMMCNGMLAGLVAITAPCAFVNPVGAAIIGVVAGYLVVFSVFFWEARGVDDPVGAISVHGVNGLWGVLSVGIFATGKYGAGWNGVVRDEMVKLYGSDGVRGLLYGDFSQFIMQVIDCAA